MEVDSGTQPSDMVEKRVAMTVGTKRSKILGAEMLSNLAQAEAFGAVEVEILEPSQTEVSCVILKYSITLKYSRTWNLMDPYGTL